MTEKDRNVFFAEMSRTAAVLKAQVTTPLLEGYWEAFEDEDIGNFSVACRKARESFDFMPSIRELRALIPRKKGYRPVLDPYLERLLQPWEPKEKWPDSVGRPRLAPAPKNETEMERSIRLRLLAMSENK